MRTISILAPYRSEAKEIRQECNLSTIDVVERSGYVSPEKKIEAYVQSGSILQNIRTNGEEFDVQGGETENEPDSDEYVDELTQDAENCTDEPLPQFIDKITAVEKLESVEKTLTSNESERKASSKKRKSEQEEKEKFISDFSNSLAKAINYNKEAEPKL